MWGLSWFHPKSHKMKEIVKDFKLYRKQWIPRHNYDENLYKVCLKRTIEYLLKLVAMECCKVGIVPRVVQAHNITTSQQFLAGYASTHLKRRAKFKLILITRFMFPCLWTNLGLYLILPLNLNKLEPLGLLGNLLC